MNHLTTFKSIASINDTARFSAEHLCSNSPTETKKHSPTTVRCQKDLWQKKNRQKRSKWLCFFVNAIVNYQRDNGQCDEWIQTVTRRLHVFHLAKINSFSIQIAFEYNKNVKIVETMLCQRRWRKMPPETVIKKTNKRTNNTEWEIKGKWRALCSTTSNNKRSGIAWIKMSVRDNKSLNHRRSIKK